MCRGMRHSKIILEVRNMPLKILLVQCPDQNFCFFLLELYDKWIAGELADKPSFTKSGNPRNPSKTVMCNFVVQAWNQV